MDGRLEEVLPGGYMELADEAHLPVGCREAIARQEEGFEAQSEMQKLSVVSCEFQMLSYSS